MSRAQAIPLISAEREGARAAFGAVIRLVLVRLQRVPTVRMFRSDPLLLFAFSIFALCTWAPMTVTPFLPLQDLPNHVGMTSIWWDTLLGRGLAGHYYIANLRPLPYWTSFILMVLARPWLGALGVAKFVVGLVTVLMPVGVMRLMMALRRDPRLGLWAFILCWDYNMAWGWFAHFLAVVLLLFCLANILEAKDIRGAMRVWPLTFLMGLTHVLPTGALFVMAGLSALVAENRWQRVGLHALALTGSALGLLPWLASQIGGDRVTLDARPEWSFIWHSIPQKLELFLEHTLSLIPGESAALIAGIVFSILAFGPLLLTGIRARAQSGSLRAQPAVLALSALLLYFLLPFGVYGPIWHLFTYPRFASLSLLFLLFVPAPDLRGWRALWLLPGVIGFFAYTSTVYDQFEEFGEEARPFLEIIDAVKPDSAIATLSFDDHSAATKLGSYNQFHAYIVAAKKGYDPFLFDYASSPLIYREDVRPPQTSWDEPELFNMESIGKYYDYVLVQGLASDPLVAEPRVRLVKEASRWRLYSVRGRAGVP